MVVGIPVFGHAWHALKKIVVKGCSLHAHLDTPASTCLHTFTHAYVIRSTVQSNRLVGTRCWSAEHMATALQGCVGWGLRSSEHTQPVPSPKVCRLRLLTVGAHGNRRPCKCKVHKQYRESINAQAQVHTHDNLQTNTHGRRKSTTSLDCANWKTRSIHTHKHIKC